MTIMKDAFDHHVWATLTLIDVCKGLQESQLSTAPEGTFGSIIDTMRHLVVADSWYLFVLSGETIKPAQDEPKTLDEMRAGMERNGDEWTSLLDVVTDPDEWLIRKRDDGSETHAPVGIRHAQVLHHGTDHRSQICTALTLLGVKPPDIDVWDFGMQAGRTKEIPPRG